MKTMRRTRAYNDKNDMSFTFIIYVPYLFNAFFIDDSRIKLDIWQASSYNAPVSCIWPIFIGTTIDTQWCGVAIPLPPYLDLPTSILTGTTQKTMIVYIQLSRVAGWCMVLLPWYLL